MATAILKEIFDIELTRTRDSEVLNKLDIVYDVGGGEFDHHGIDKVYREDGIPYAACGLIWNKFGKDVVHYKDPQLTEREIDSVFGYVDRVLIEGIDAIDNGVKIEDGEIPLMNISLIISRFNPTWYSEKSEDEAFNEAVEVSSRVLRNTINSKFAVLKSISKVNEAYENRKNSSVIVLNTYCPFGEALRDIDENEEVLYVVYPNKENYAAQTVRGRNREERKPFPKSWAGKRDEELAEVTGVEDAVFCHTGRFIAVAGSFEGIMNMVELALKEPEEKKPRTIMDFIRHIFLKR